MNITNTYPVFLKLKRYRNVFFKDGSGNLKEEDYSRFMVEQLNLKIRKDISRLLNIADKNSISYCTVDDVTKAIHLSNVKPKDTDFYYVCIEHEEVIYIFMYADGDYILMNYGRKTMFYEIIKDSLAVVLPQLRDSRKYIFETDRPYCKYIINTYGAFCEFCHQQLKEERFSADYNGKFINYCLSHMDDMSVEKGDYRFKKTFKSLEDDLTRSLSFVRYNDILIIEDFQVLKDVEMLYEDNDN